MAPVQETTRKLFNGVRLRLGGRRGASGVGSNSLSTLHQAVQEGNEKEVDMLQSEDNANAEDSYGRVAMHYAAQNGNEKIMRALVSTKDVDKQDRLGRTALHWAVENNHTKIVKFLIDEKEADVNIQDYSKHTALYRAAWRGWDELVDLLLGRGAAYDLPDLDGRTPLHVAADRNHGAIVALLLARIIYDDTENPHGRVPLAVEKGIEIFWSNTMSSLSGRILLWAAKKGHMGIIEALLDKGIKINDQLQDIGGLNILQATAEEGDLDAVDRLLKIGGIPDNKALQIATLKGHLEIVNRFLDAGVGPGQEALLTAAQEGHLEIVNRFLNSGVEPDQIALQIAASRGHLELVNCFLDAGVQLDRGALGWVGRLDREDIASRLREVITLHRNMSM